MRRRACGPQLVALALGSGETDGVAYGVHVSAFALGLVGAVIWKTSYPSADEDLQAFVASSFSVTRPAEALERSTSSRREVLSPRRGRAGSSGAEEILCL